VIHNRGFGVRELGLTVALALSLGGCEQKTVERPPPKSPVSPSPPTSPTSPTPAAPEPDAVYVVRGRVVELPDPKNPTKEFRVHHEPIPTFKTPAGEVVGMREMIMPFPVSDPSLLEGVAVGDIVELTFADWYKPMRTYKVTKLVKLAPDTKLELKDQ
jgi:Cu/Ag efflux protein CusF